ncbi:MAG: hypothetical protein FWD40_04555 [Treponema sp.]|nr:hypothetical protein [Treponema sp.]
MTLSERNTFFKAGIAFCAVCILFVTAVSFFVIPVYPEMDQNVRRPAFALLSSDYFAVHSSIALSVLFSLAGIILIFCFFERTSVPEILYVAAFILSFAFEALRLILPLHFIMNFPSFYLLMAFKFLLFIRFFGIFSLFAAGLCAAGLEVQKTRNVIFVIVIAALVVTMGVPVDVLNWETSLNMVNGYSSIFRMIELTAFITTMISFFVAAKIRGSGEYTYIAIGVMFALAGRSILINADNWTGPVSGILLLSVGTWFLCSKLHKIHLWL